MKLVSLFVWGAFFLFVLTYCWVGCAIAVESVIEKVTWARRALAELRSSRDGALTQTRRRLRAGDADRERALLVLREALVAGQLELGEYELRWDRVSRSCTLGGLDRITADLSPARAPALQRFRPWLVAAALYNAVWGIGALALAPGLGWQVVGLVVLAYAPGYWWASRFPDRHPHIVAVGLFGKTVGPLAYLAGLATGRASPALLVVILTNDLLWWPAFAAYLRAAARARGGWSAFLRGV